MNDPLLQKLFGSAAKLNACPTTGDQVIHKNDCCEHEQSVYESATNVSDESDDPEGN